MFIDTPVSAALAKRKPNLSLKKIKGFGGDAIAVGADDFRKKILNATISKLDR
jgi:hypothetical protein